MKVANWNPELFARTLDGAKTPTDVRAYQFMRLSLSREQRKLLAEWKTFLKFCRALNLPVDQWEIEMLDANSSSPAPPDLRCPLYGGMHYFELGEVVQENLRAANMRPRQPFQERRLPLAHVTASLETMLKKKLAKEYNPEAKPLSLLLYYSTEHSCWDFTGPQLAAKRLEIQAMLDSSVFDYVWIFNARTNRLLDDFCRTSLLLGRASN